MIDYELAKELKDAGFPQKDTLMYGGTILFGPAGDTSPEEAYVPTLEELIEATADQSFFLAPVVKGPATAKPVEWCAAINGVPNSYAPTALEACAKAYIAKNKKGYAN